MRKAPSWSEQREAAQQKKARQPGAKGEEFCEQRDNAHDIKVV